jgi:ATP-binding cassette, subfamily A (ABC1), member 3
VTEISKAFLIFLTEYLFLVQMDYTKFLYGLPLIMSQIWAMVLKKILYSTRNYILLIIQLLIPGLFVVITMLLEDTFNGNKDLPELPIELAQYLETTTILANGVIESGSAVEKISASYKSLFEDSPADHRLSVVQEDFEDHILGQYRESVSRTNLEFMVGASFSDAGITAWFNNQAYHTAPLAINLVNNAILKSFASAVKVINVVNKPLPYTLATRVS